MILNSKETTIAYRCPVCGKFIFGMAGIFTLSGDLIKLKCDCGGSELVIVYTDDRKIKITVPCLFCPSPHTYIISSDAFFSKDILALSCTFSSVDVCFIGNMQDVIEAAKRSDTELEHMIEDMGFESTEEFMTGKKQITDTSDDNVDEDFRIDYAQVEEIVHYMLTELCEEGNISCGCKAGDTARYDFEFKGDSVRIFCHTCNCEKIIPMSSVLAADDFLDIDKLELKAIEK